MRKKSGFSRRTFMKTSAAASAAYAVVPHTVLGANERVLVGVIGVGGKGGGHCKQFDRMDGCSVIAVSDADAGRMNGKPGKHCQDMREMLEMKDVDAVVIATPNHWHSLAAIWACQAGKHVYVEKPVSHYIWEGRQMCEARKKYNRIVQTGTQQLTCPAVQRCGEDIRAGRYGKIKWVHCFKMHNRGSVGKRSEPMQIPDHIDYDLWAGPAPKDPIYREKFHYDWHWDLRWGDGEMGNWNVHYTGDLCHMLGFEKLPNSVVSAGGRFLWDDAADAPNMLFSMMDYQGVPVTLEIRDLPVRRDSNTQAAYRGRRGGNIIMCEKAVIKIARGGGKAYAVDGDGKAGEAIEQYKGNGGAGHEKNFIRAIQAGDHGQLNAPVEIGHAATGVCHLSTISYLLGKKASPDEIRARMDDNEDIRMTVEEQLKQLDALEVDMDRLMLGPKLTFDPDREQFVGEHAAEANKLVRLESRKGFVVPEVRG